MFFGISQSNINGCEKLNVEEYEKYFEENCIKVIKQIKKWKFILLPFKKW